MDRGIPLRPEDPASLGEYRLRGRLGEGGQGAVFLGESPSGALVAIKVLSNNAVADPVARRRFAGEVAVARQISSFCIAAVLDADLDGERPYLVSEYVDGPTLQDAVAVDGPRSGGSLHRLAVGTITALAAIHQAGIVHRDLKPHNVMLGSDGPRVIDFGIARPTDATVTLASGVVGSIAYMSPEQVSGEMIGPPSDLFSWAIMMGYAATGEPLFGRDAIPAVIHRILNTEPNLSAIPPGLREIVVDCLAKRPENRPTAHEVLMRLIDPSRPPVTSDPNRSLAPETVFTNELPGTTAVDTPPPPPAPTPHRRRRLPLLIGGVAVIAALAATAAVAFWPDDTTSSPTSSPAPSFSPPTGATLVFHDSFDYQSSGWDGYSYNPTAPGDSRTYHGYEIGKGIYTVRADAGEPTDGALAPKPEKQRPGGPLQDVIVETDAWLREGTKAPGDLGLACRVDEDVPNGYVFLIGLDGTAQVIRRVQGSDTTLQQATTTAPRIGEHHRLQATCRTESSGRTRLTWTVDGKQLIDVVDPTAWPTSTQAQVGPIARTSESGGGIVTFSIDDFSVYQLPKA